MPATVDPQGILRDTLPPLDRLILRHPGSTTIAEHFCVFRDVPEYPRMFVCRRFEIGPKTADPTDDYALAEDLQSLRDKLPPGLFCMPRMVQDHPTVVEVWF